MMRIRITALIILLALLTGFQTAQAGSNTELVFGIDWSPDGRWIAATSNQGVWFFDTDNPAADPLHYRADDSVPTLAFDNAGTSAAVFDETADEVVILDVATGEPSLVLYPKFAPEESFSVIYDIDYSSDGHYLVLANTSALYMVDAQTGEQIAVIFEFNDGRPYSYSDWVTSIAED